MKVKNAQILPREKSLVTFWKGFDFRLSCFNHSRNEIFKAGGDKYHEMFENVI